MGMVLGWLIKLRLWPTIIAGIVWAIDQYGHLIRDWATQNPDAAGAVVIALTGLANLAKSPLPAVEAPKD